MIKAKQLKTKEISHGQGAKGACCVDRETGNGEARGRAESVEAPPSSLEAGAVENTVDPHPAKDPSPKTLGSPKPEGPPKNLAAGGKNIALAEAAMREAFAARGMVVIPSQFADVAAELVRCGPLISAALEHAGGFYTLADIFKAILAQEYQLWPATESVVLTEFVLYPQKKVLNLFLAAGKLPELLKMLPDLERYAEGHGCAAVTLTGRKGWTRSALVQKGYSFRSVMMGKEISYAGRRKD